MDKASLVKQCQSGDRSAWEILYRLYLPSMRRVVAYHVHDPEAVSDILHDGFIIAFASIGSLNKVTQIDAWMTSIMKNLAIQYLRDESKHRSVPITETPLAEKADEPAPVDPELSWEELNRIIDRLPQGYGKVFRMAVLDGLSHKKIGAILGIAPHSSSSQLAHAKALLRRMISRYRFEMGAISMVAILLLVWQGVFRHKDRLPSTPLQDKEMSTHIPEVADTLPLEIIEKNDIPQVASIPSSNKSYRPQPAQEQPAATQAADTIPAAAPDSIPADTLMHIPDIKGMEELYAQAEIPARNSYHESGGWELSLAYSGYSGADDINRYKQFVPSEPNGNAPITEVEMTEKSRYYLPVTIGLSLNKSITSRWSIGTGLRYTLLRSDIMAESELSYKQTIQRIHYIGVPLKLNYRIFTLGGLSVYGQGGGALDIPVSGKQSINEFNWSMNRPGSKTIRVHAPLQWSVEGGIGIQYHFTPSLSIYAEPSLRYYFNQDSPIKTIRQEKALEFTVPIGLRLNW